MSPEQTRAVPSLCVLASFADGNKHERERAQIKRLAEGFSNGDATEMPMLYQDILMKRITLPDIVAQLDSEEAKQLAFEMAVCVCDVDGELSEAERRFLDEASAALGLETSAAASFSGNAQAIVRAPIAGASVEGNPVGTSSADEAELDRTILNAAILNGALELLPETLSTMAIIPLQMKLVYRIGKVHGFELDSSHVKDFLATAGVGLTSQYLEQAGRKLLGGLLGKVGGGLLRGVGKHAVSSSMSFATTYALGHVAKRYYAGGRELSTQMLKDAYANAVHDAQGLGARYLSDIRAKAKTVNAGSVLAMVRGA